MTHDIRARVTDVSISAQKLRLVIDLVRGKSANEALDILKFVPSKAAHPVSKVVASAVANAENNMGISRDVLVVHKITADEGRTRKWRRFGARGRFKPWLRRAAHITVVLREKEGTAVPSAAATK
ncbi:MAG TPA: 50S ribosomal protein L22 [Anaerolineales bacterium]|uniref:Large ribosomal subunit protein uL22 n=1 Tax=uncultured Chloroflexi bacterium Rifle_16ft_4_minimus_5762 TaxID=1665077 RepID=A0A0H4TD81_9CHLR|nr:50S ribosomal protein L22, large subunit ribosomal protein L22 [uncultured Chloroflexi bacterium Rifle_16ft_4_minimus_5762]HKY79438.1 50S ribosomal protein L22 [Anaerolineales bacterium]HLE73481.1 50S ribosomal protein L22 [Anaerolineales bacterium]